MTQTAPKITLSSLFKQLFRRIGEEMSKAIEENWIPLLSLLVTVLVLWFGFVEGLEDRITTSEVEIRIYREEHKDLKNRITELERRLMDKK